MVDGEVDQILEDPERARFVGRYEVPFERRVAEWTIERKSRKRKQGEAERIDTVCIHINLNSFQLRTVDIN